MYCFTQLPLGILSAVVYQMIVQHYPDKKLMFYLIAKDQIYMHISRMSLKIQIYDLCFGDH